MLDLGTSTIPPLNTLSVHPAAMYALFFPYGIVNLQEEEIPENAPVLKAKGVSISEVTEDKSLHCEYL